MVDDAGRLLDVCEVGDDPAGYAKVGLVLAERSGGPSSAAIATDSEDYVVVSLLGAAGRPIAVADDDSADDFAERFTDDESPEEVGALPAERRAIGMARALQAGALSAAALPVPRNLSAYKPVLAAHAALLVGRQAATVALREVLRELYPAALRAYSNPADPVSLAVLDAVPEPGMLSGGGGRGHDGTIADTVVADLVADGVADQATVSDAVTALKNAISETPRRGSAAKSLGSTTAEAVRQAIAAVRAYDAGSQAVVAALSTRTAVAPPVTQRRALTAGADDAPAPRRDRAPEAASRAQTVSRDARSAALTPVHAAPPPAAGGDARSGAEHVPGDRSNYAPPPGDATPGAQTQRPVSPADAGEPFRATLTIAAINSARAERQRANSARPERGTSPASEFGPADYSVPVPTPRPEAPPPGSRANWPLVGTPDDDRANEAPAHPRDDQPAPGGGRITPPWLADDLPPEPPMLRLVEPSLSDHATQEQPVVEEPNAGNRPLRLVEGDPVGPPGWTGRSGSDEVERTETSLPPVPDEGDDDLLIFAATRSAWFSKESNLEWTSSADSGWQAAEQAARPTVGEKTRAGLPKRVPQANLVPGSPLREERPLRIVRNADSIAKNTSGYFQGWRRGQEIGGYAVGGRPGRESAGGWDFSRDQEHEDNPEFEFRSARY